MDSTAYDAHAEHFDLLVDPMWRVLTPELTTALQGLDPRHGPAVDVGAGTGRGTELVAHLNPGVQVLAIEPSVGLRTALFVRIGRDADLARRVTVLPETIDTAALPDRLAAVLLANAVTELSPQQRRTLFASAARRLAPGAPLIANLGVPGTGAAAIVVRIGRREYRNTGVATPGESGSVRWRITTDVLDGGCVVQQVTTEHTSWRLTPPQLFAELAAAGLRPRRTGVLVVATA